MSEWLFLSTNGLTTDDCVVGNGSLGLGDDLVTGHFEVGNGSLDSVMTW